MNQKSFRFGDLPRVSLGCEAGPGSQKGRLVSLASNVGRNLETLLHEQDLTQREFAKKIGVSQSKVSRWLSGRLPDDEDFDKIATFFNRSYEQLVAAPGKVEIPNRDIDRILAELAKKRGFKLEPI